jgi:predicted nucleic acid-binding Zn finger protein
VNFNSASVDVLANSEHCSVSLYLLALVVDGRQDCSKIIRVSKAARSLHKESTYLHTVYISFDRCNVWRSMDNCIGLDVQLSAIWILYRNVPSNLPDCPVDI